MLPLQTKWVVVGVAGTGHWGYAPDGWTGPLVRDMIQRLFRVDYHPEYVPRLLRRLGWSPQKPERRARERNDQYEISATKKVQVEYVFYHERGIYCNRALAACGSERHADSGAITDHIDLCNPTRRGRKYLAVLGT